MDAWNPKSDKPRSGLISHSGSLDFEGVIDLENLTKKAVDLILELNGQPIRFSRGAGSQEHLIAAALDSLGEFDVEGVGITSRKQATRFDGFQAR